MSLRLPSVNSPLREFFSVERDLVPFAKLLQLPSFTNAVRGGRKMMAAPGNGSIASIQSLCMRASGEVCLIRIGPKGGVKQLWNFGRP